MAKKKKFHVRHQINNLQERQIPVNRIIVPIKGMHCRSCEILIEEKLREIPEIKSVQISYKKKSALVYFNNSLDQNLIRLAIEEAGYEVGVDDSKAWLSRDPNIYKDLIVAVFSLFFLYFLAKKIGLFDLSVGSISNPSSLSVVLLIGITAGFSSCMALVGGLVLGISARHSEKHPEATSTQKFRPHLFFNIGRILSFFLLGGVIGLIGKALQLSGTTLGIMTILVGFVMLILGLQLTELFPKLKNINFTLPSSVSKLFGLKKHNEKEYSHTNSIVTGALTFFLPCGFTQAMQLYAMSTGSFWTGAMIMGIFALGTAPGLLGIGGLTSVIKGGSAKKFFKFAGVVVVILAFLNISNGLNLTGIKGKLASSNKAQDQQNADDPNVKIENGVQVIRMDQVGAGYKPKNITIKKGIPSKWIINSKSQSCAASIYSQKLGIQKNLDPGENIIEFTPQETGKIPFSCSMGMYTGSFNVIENNSPVPQKPSTDNSTSTERSPAPSAAAAPPKETQNPADEQVIKTAYTYVDDIRPDRFTVKVGKPVRFEVEAKEDGQGCMSSITIPDLVKDFYYLEKGKTFIFKFTPQKKGSFYITCAMGSPRGIITVE